MTEPGDTTAPRWRDDPLHRAWLETRARALLRFFDASLRDDGGFDLLDGTGRPLPRGAQELHTTTRLVHSYALGQAIGHPGSERMIDAGIRFLLDHHRDTRHGGYVWSVGPGGRDDKLAYGHAFVLLAAASARQVGHPDADTLLDDIAAVIEDRFWDDGHGLLREEFTRDWSPLSDYRGMNANMHAAEAMLAAHEATGDAHWLDRAGRILGFLARMAEAHGHRLPEHYDADWRVDPDYRGDPMFRPHGTTPGHSFEVARLLLHHGELAGRPAPAARPLIETALADAWLPEGGIAYTLEDGAPAIRDRFWWPVAEAILAVAALLATDPRREDEDWYRRLWTFAASRLIEPIGAWRPELDGTGMFPGRPDIYHALQATLYPLAPGVARPFDGLRRG